MGGYSIRRLRADELSGESYSAIFEQIVADKEAEYEAEFGPEYRAVHPFKFDGAAVHQLVMRKLAAQ